MIKLILQRFRSYIAWLLPVLVLFLSEQGISQNFTISGGRTHSGLVCPNGKVYTAGSNALGEAGNGSTGGNYTSFTDADAVADQDDLPSISILKAGSGSHKLALGCDSLLYSWGSNGAGQLGHGEEDFTNASSEYIRRPGLNDPQPDTVVGGETGRPYLDSVVYIAGGTNTSYAIRSTGRLLAWGNNNSNNYDGQGGDYGMLGTGNMTDSVVPTPHYVRDENGDILENVVAVESGDENGYALTEDGTVYSWGDNHNSSAQDDAGEANPPLELGREVTGDDHQYAIPVQADATGDCNQGNCDMDGPLTNIKVISGGDRHGLAIDEDGNVWSWGGNWGRGQLGDNMHWNGSAAARRVRGGEQGGDFLENIVSVSAGQAHSVAIDEDGYAYAWGANGFFDNSGIQQPAGQLAPGSGLTEAHRDTLVPHYMHTCDGDTMKNAAGLSSGDGWSFVVTDNGTIYAAGYNQDGQLGIGSTTNKACLTEVTAPCTVPDSCPEAAIEPDIDTLQLCIPINQELFAGSEGSSSYHFQWYHEGGTVGSDDPYYTANDTGRYVVKVWDDRLQSEVSGCKTCDTTYDTLNIVDIEAPFEKDSTSYCGDSLAYYSVSPDTGNYKWFSSPTGNDTLNPSDSSHEITVPIDSTTSTPNCDYALYAEDISQFVDSAGEYTPPCGTYADENTRTEVRINASQDFTLDSIKFMQGNPGYGGDADYSLTIYRNDPDGGPWDGGCSCNLPGPGAQIGTSDTVNYSYPSGSPAMRTIPVDFDMKKDSAYWVEIQGPLVRNYTCSGNYSYWDSRNVIEMANAYRDGGTWDGYGNVLTSYVSVGTQYPCGRLQICAEDSVSCTQPVNFTHFTAAASGEDALLEWGTSMEKNNERFVIQRSMDGEVYQKVGTVEGAGNSSNSRSYSFTDKDVPAGEVVYYRIVQYDYDGGKSSTSIRSVNFKKQEPIVQPNPNNGTFTVTVGDKSLTYNITMVNVLGQQVYQTSSSGTNNVNIDASGVPSGTYYLRITDGHTTWTKRMVKQ